MSIPENSNLTRFIDNNFLHLEQLPYHFHKNRGFVNVAMAVFFKLWCPRQGWVIVRLSYLSLAIFLKNRHGYINKTSIFHESGMEVVSIQENYGQ